MVSPYSQMVNGVINTEEKSLEGRVHDLSDRYEDIIYQLSIAAETTDIKEKKKELEKALVYLQKRIDSL